MRYTSRMSSGSFIRKMRIDAELSQSELARRSGIARPVINSYERGTREPSAAALARLAEAAGRRLMAVTAATIDVHRNGRVLGEVLDLAELLPSRRRSDQLEFPPLPGPYV